MREVEHGHSNEEYDEPALQRLPIRDLRCADDTALLATTPRGLETLIQSVKYRSPGPRGSQSFAPSGIFLVVL